LKVKEEEKNMRFPNEAALKREKLNKDRFVLGSVGERNKIMKDLASFEETLEKRVEKFL